MTSKDKTVKIKAKVNLSGWITCGKVYSARSGDDCYYINNDSGFDVSIHKSHFDVVPDIELGSEWYTHDGEKLIVNYVGREWVTYTFPSGGEFSTYRSRFLSTFVPANKTVTMYFYYIGKHLCANDYVPQGYTHAFTREIELP